MGVCVDCLTKEASFSDVQIKPGSKLRIYDTPGTNSNKFALKNSMILRTLITTLPFNLFLIQVRLSSRLDETLR
jgi:hypothetical protein